MPKTVRVKHKETGEVRDAFAIDAESYDDEWELIDDASDDLPAKVVTTTMGKPIVPKQRSSKPAD